MRILVVEDERKTAAFLAKGLREAGFNVDFAHDGEAALQRVRAVRHDLLIVDVMLPKKDGWSVVAELRRGGLRTPILFLTARDSVRDRVKGLELGADDYLVKPFAFSELLARVRALLRRAGEAEPLRRQVGNLTVDLETRRVTRGAQEVLLTPREFDLLAYLMRHHGQTVTRQMLAKEVWREPHRATPLDNVIDVHVAHLRRKIDEGQRLTLIHTVRGVGFVLKAEGP